LNFISIEYYFDYTFAQQQPVINDPKLKAEVFAKGLSSPTSMAFIDSNNILVLEKTGLVCLISNGILQEQPLFQVQVANNSERGLLGIATINRDAEVGSSSVNKDIGDRNQAATTIFLYYTESEPLRNRIYRYQWNGETLVNSTLILDLPGEPGPNHDGGKLAIGPDHYFYAVIGDLNHNGKLQNIIVGPEPDDTSVILRVNPNDGLPVNNNPLFSNSNNNNTNSSENSKLNRYYAYGIRNSFGMDFDPVTGALWDTENGPESYDEINLVNPGFNSGWKKVMGPISKSNITEGELISFPGSKYADPVFSWTDPIGVTDIEFLNSSKLGEKYKNNIFIGDIRNGNLYYFEVNEKRDGLKFNDSQSTGLTDLVADNEDESSKVTFGTGFGSKRGITDIETGPDGFLYIVSFGEGVIYRIAPPVNSSGEGAALVVDEEEENNVEV
jgi:glucose/arabinose dehydrogenase